MEFKFGKEPGSNVENQHEEQGQQDKGRQTTLLVLLLLLVGVVGYLYFFTGLIRPQEAPPKPVPPPQVVKQPLPPKGEVPPQPVAKPVEPAKPGVPSAAPVATVKPANAPAAVAPAPAAAVKMPPAPPAAVAKPAPVPPPVPAKPAVAQPSAKAEAKPPVQPAAKKPEPAKVVAAPVQKTAAPAPKAAAPAAEKKADAAKPTQKKAPAAAKSNGPWTLVIGLYTVEAALAEDMAKVRKAGLTPVITMGPKKPVAMHRLQYGVFDDKAEAQKAVEMLRRQTGSGFSVLKGGKHEVFAGSYAIRAGAESEQQRLSADGVKVTLQKTAVPIASRKLTAGTFTDRKAAEAAVKKAKAAGAGSPVLE